MKLQLYVHLSESSEASLVVPDFSVSVYSSSCNLLFCCLMLSCFLSIYILLVYHPALGIPLNTVEVEIEGARITWNAVHRNGEIRDY